MRSNRILRVRKRAKKGANTDKNAKTSLTGALRLGLNFLNANIQATSKGVWSESR